MTRRFDAFKDHEDEVYEIAIDVDTIIKVTCHRAA